MLWTCLGYLCVTKITFDNVFAVLASIAGILSKLVEIPVRIHVTCLAILPLIPIAFSLTTSFRLKSRWICFNLDICSFILGFSFEGWLSTADGGREADLLQQQPQGAADSPIRRILHVLRMPAIFSEEITCSAELHGFCSNTIAAIISRSKIRKPTDSDLLTEPFRTCEYPSII